MDEVYMDVKCQFHPPYMGGCPDYEPKTMEIRMENDDKFDRIMEMNTEAERRRFAAMAMQGLLANCKMVPSTNTPDEDMPKLLAEVCVKIADALIAKLNKK